MTYAREHSRPYTEVRNNCEHFPYHSESGDTGPWFAEGSTRHPLGALPVSTVACILLGSALYTGTSRRPDPEEPLYVLPQERNSGKSLSRSLCPENGHTCITSNETWSKMKSFMLCSKVSKPTPRTKFLCPALPEKEGLGQPVSTHYLTWFPPKMEGNPALADASCNFLVPAHFGL